uniref:Uncharacterized protein n=1 Tax=Timema cristinae TaxID=61476 RepID=A0A7R9DC91_TIMCR|nr:unnamed protein product [Timema cristinae]
MAETSLTNSALDHVTSKAGGKKLSIPSWETSSNLLITIKTDRTRVTPLSGWPPIRVWKEPEERAAVMR